MIQKMDFTGLIQFIASQYKINKGVKMNRDNKLKELFIEIKQIIIKSDQDVITVDVLTGIDIVLEVLADKEIINSEKWNIYNNIHKLLLEGIERIK